MSRGCYFSSSTPHRIHEAMYLYDTPFGTGLGEQCFSNKFGQGKSAYEIAVENGFSGTEQEWLENLQGKDGITPHIGENGNWFIGDFDTNVSASVVSDYNLLFNKPSIEGKEMINNVELDSMLETDIDALF